MTLDRRARCARCGLPMHRYGWPTDNQGHEPRGELDDAMELLAKVDKPAPHFTAKQVARVQRLLTRSRGRA